MAVTAPTVLTRIIVSPEDATAAKTFAARGLRQSLNTGRMLYSGVWERFQREAPPFVVRGLKELEDEWRRLETDPA